MTAIDYYTTSTKGIGGKIKRRIADFKVKEITESGKICKIKVFTDSEKIELKKKWPKKQGETEHLHLTLEKFNMDMNLAIRKISRFIRTSRKRIGYAGMKDKRAITSQRISIWKPDLERLREFNSRYIDLRDAEWGNERIDLGMLKGNEFEITIRDIDLDKKELKRRINRCFREIKAGIANYFGEQRFGGIREITHLVGREFVMGDIEKGVMLYLTASVPREEEAVKIARENLKKSKDFSKASKEFPVKYRYERAIIHHLCKHPKDFVGAFGKLPKQLRYMFTHAYQSYLFNKIINMRIDQGIGLKKVEGDILIEDLPSALLCGFESEFAKGKAGEIERKVLKEEGLELRNFKIKKMPELSSKGSRKPIVLKPERLKLLSIGDDELNEGKLKATISFRLSKGNYATTVLRELMKND